MTYNQCLNSILECCCKVIGKCARSFTVTGLDTLSRQAAYVSHECAGNLSQPGFRLDGWWNWLDILRVFQA